MALELDWSRAASDFHTPEGGSPPVAEMIDRFRSWDPLRITTALEPDIAEAGKPESCRFLLFAIRQAVTDHALTDEEVRSIKHVGRIFRIQEGDLLEHQRGEVIDLLCEELQRLLEDQEIDPEEAVHKVKLQEVLGLNYDQFVELTAPEIARIITALLHVLEANSGELSSSDAVAWFDRRVAALDTVYEFDPNVIAGGAKHALTAAARSRSKAGYVYVLTNEAMPGLVKVGRTRRSAHDRAADLSGPTGIPTPFQVVMEVLVSDCVEAERFVHKELAKRGYRLKENREFFRAPLHEVTGLLVEVRERLPGSPSELLPTHPDQIAKAEEWFEAAVASNKERSRQEFDDLMGPSLGGRDELFGLAAEVVIRNDSGSPSLLQRRLKIGYGRAARILDQLEGAGIVGPSRGSEPRAVLATLEELDERPTPPLRSSSPRLEPGAVDSRARKRVAIAILVGLAVLSLVYSLLWTP